MLTLDLGERQLHEYACQCCQALVQRSWSYVHGENGAYAVYVANCYRHRDKDRDAWLDVILGSWQAPYADHVTFGCRVGPTGTGDPTK